MIRTFLLLAVFAVLGCAAVQCPATTTDPLARCANGIPNLRAVSAPGRPTLYPRGQPTVEGWQSLHGVLHVATSVKLNDPIESFGQAEDQPARVLGMAVALHTIPPVDYGWDLRTPGQLREGPTLRQAAEAVAAIAAGLVRGPVYLHCTHGRDRTGLIAALFRVFVDGIAPDVAHAEMITAGFRPINRGLDAVWDFLFEDGSPGARAARQASFRALLAIDIPRRFPDEPTVRPCHAGCLHAHGGHGACPGPCSRRVRPGVRVRARRDAPGCRRCLRGGARGLGGRRAGRGDQSRSTRGTSSRSTWWASAMGARPGPGGRGPSTVPSCVRGST